MAASKKWRESDTIKFVELYEKAECLWNFRTPGYKIRNVRDRAIQHIIEEMNLPDFGVSELKNKIKNIRSTYQQEVNKIKRSRQGFGSDILEEYRTNLAWFPIADRFLGLVINSSKNPPKIEEEDSSFYQSNQSAFYNLVETEMVNGDMGQEFEEKFTPFPVALNAVKEEIDNEEDYNGHLEVTQTKKRRLSQPPLSEGPPLDDTNKDEWYYFGNNIACQLRNLPLLQALLCQKKIMDVLFEERLKYIDDVKSTN